MNRGFTLIELLGALAILAILAVITIPIVQGVIEDSLNNSKKVQEESFEKAAKSWASANVFALPAANSYQTVSLYELIEQGYLEATKENDGYHITISGSDDEYDLNNSCVKITNNGTSTKAKYKYEFKEGSENCKN